MKAQTFGQAFALLFLVSACDVTGICKVGKTGSEASDCPFPHTFCYGGEKPQEGAKGICVYGELSSEGKQVAKITTWKLALPNQTEVAPSKWDKRDAEAKASQGNAYAPWVGMAEARVEVEVVGASLNENLKVWTGHGVHATCRPPAERKPQGEVWTCTFREGWAASESATETVEVKAQVGKAEVRERTYRVLCSHNLDGLVGDPVRPPLAMSGKRLLFGSSTPPEIPMGAPPEIPEANNSLYVFDTDACALVGKLHTGTLQGPMTVLGDTGQVAVALGNHGPVGRAEQRLSLVNVSGKTPNFVYDDSKRDCVENSFVFNQGLSLMSIENDSTNTPWRLVAPTNHPTCNKSLLAVYTPEAKSDNCTWYQLIPNCFWTPMAQDDNQAVVGIYDSDGRAFLSGWVFMEKWISLGSGSALNSIEKASPPAISENTQAIAESNFWVKDLSVESSAAVDSKGWVYFAKKQNNSNGYQLQLESPLLGTHNRGSPEKNSTPFDGNPVGSPILGEPLSGREPQVYLVTDTGKVLAYGTELGEPLWVHNLGIRIASTAQPVLSGNTLWVVGARGEIRGIRVSSNGLNRKAHWPKTFRDNCNTSSRLSTPDTLPSCF